jgi:hypothetical protein
MEIVEGIFIGQFSAFQLHEHADPAIANEMRAQRSNTPKLEGPSIS